MRVTSYSFPVQDHDEEAIEQLREEAEADTDVIGRLSDVWHALFAKVRLCDARRNKGTFIAVWRISAAAIRGAITEYDANVRAGAHCNRATVDTMYLRRSDRVRLRACTVLFESKWILAGSQEVIQSSTSSTSCSQCSPASATMRPRCGRRPRTVSE